MKHLFAYFVLLSLCTSLFAQENNWDSALDQYERICNECISLRARSIAGEKIATSSVTGLLGQLSGLRKTLQMADGTMTQAQRKRFADIRRRYGSIFGIQRTVSAKTTISPVSTPILPSLASAPRHKESLLLCPGTSTKTVAVVTTKPKTKFDAIVYMNVPDCAPGIMLGASSSNWGGFVKGTVSPDRQKSSYNCKSDGTSDNGFIWTTGEEKKCRLSITAGAVYNLGGRASVYFGAGYGSRSVLWQDSNSRWAKVKDHSTSGLANEAGVLYRYRHLSLMLGFSTISFKNLSADIGIGIFIY